MLLFLNESDDVFVILFSLIYLNSMCFLFLFFLLIIIFLLKTKNRNLESYCVVLHIYLFICRRLTEY